MKNVIIFGASGFIGKALVKKLNQENYNLTLVQRKDKNESNYWDYESIGLLSKLLDNQNIVINLAGSPILGQRWTQSIKEELINSRQLTNQLISDAINYNNNKIELFISASGIGYYGNTKDILVDESFSPGIDFVSEICQKWEEPLDNINIRKTIFRIGVVLHNSGGAYPRLAKLFNFFLGSALSDGKQYFPWIHLNDLLNMFTFVINNKEIKGTYNAVASEQVTNYEFNKSVSNFLNKPLMPNVPSFILKLVLGESSIVLLTGQKASNDKIKKAGFKFKYDNLKSCLENIEK